MFPEMLRKRTKNSIKICSVFSFRTMINDDVIFTLKSNISRAYHFQAKEADLTFFSALQILLHVIIVQRTIPVFE